jgi:hypothetical protein
MASLFSARRKPKRLARNDPQADQDDDGKFSLSPTIRQNHRSDTSNYSQFADALTDNGPIVRRPGAVKAKSKLRVSFNPGEDAETSTSTPADSDGQSHPRPVPRLGASKALQDRLRDTSIRDDKPIYSKSYLDELRNSTPSTPAEHSVDEDEQRFLDIEAKFGTSTSKLPSTQTHIPSATEIAEKKARRARLALSGTADPSPSHPTGNDQISRQADFVSLEDYDDDGEFKAQRLQVSTYLAPEKEKDTRLQREDEDIAEGFEHFIEDDPGAAKGRYSTDALHIGRKAQKAFKAKQREEMRSAIEHAEQSTDDSGSEASEDSDGAGRWAYESAQTHRGMDGLGGHGEVKIRERRPREPRETTGIVKLSVGIAGLRERVSGIEAEKERVRRRLEEVRREREEVRERARHVQVELDKLGKELEGLAREGGSAIADSAEAGDQTKGADVHANGDAEMS